MGTEGTGYLLNHVPHAAGDAMNSADTGSPNVLRFGEKGMIWLRLDLAHLLKKCRMITTRFAFLEAPL
ncbi:hypothetical protein [Paraburkholderia lacunae]|uniref:hypothetical protein n=1 Tax=Paraburkholderia lacunae TaxID=2211104 RepID=UPI001AD816F9|nr:hypothetical protein [Paraburkholderia lacunae]